MNLKKYLLISAFLLVVSSVYAEPVELTLKDGTVWNGETGEQISLVIHKGRKKSTVEGTLSRNAGQFIVVTTDTRDQVIFISDIDSISTESTTNANVDNEDTAEVTRGVHILTGGGGGFWASAKKLGKRETNKVP